MAASTPLVGSLSDRIPALVLIGRRHLRSNNSWMHNIDAFVRGPRAVLDYVRGRSPRPAAGHNPVGAISVLAFLVERFPPAPQLVLMSVLFVAATLMGGILLPRSVTGELGDVVGLAVLADLADGAVGPEPHGELAEHFGLDPRVGEGREFLRRATEVTNVWIPSGE